jgi:hypothetical protein
MNLHIAKIVGQGLKFISCKMVLIIKDMVMSWPASTLYASMATQVEIELCRMANLAVLDSSRKDVSALVSHVSPPMNLWEKPCVMPFLDYYKCDRW